VRAQGKFAKSVAHRDFSEGERDISIIIDLTILRT